MKTKNKKGLPEVSIHGDLRDVKRLVSRVGKKKTLVVFRDSSHDLYYVESKGKIKEIKKEDLKKLDKKLRLIFFQFFPSAKPQENVKENTGEIVSLPQPDAEDKAAKGKKKMKKENKGKKEKKEKTGKRAKKAGKEEKEQKSVDE